MVDETSMLHVAIQNLVVEVRNVLNYKVDGLTKEIFFMILTKYYDDFSNVIKT